MRTGCWQSPWFVRRGRWLPTVPPRQRSEVGSSTFSFSCLLCSPPIASGGSRRMEKHTLCQTRNARARFAQVADNPADCELDLARASAPSGFRSEPIGESGNQKEEHTSELQSLRHL